MLTIEMHDPEGRIMTELQDPDVSQKSVAITYAFLIAQHEGRANWIAINEAIRRRWSGRRALEHVKAMAWKHLEGWGKKEGHATNAVQTAH